jgi:hypothetical protein
MKRALAGLFAMAVGCGDTTTSSSQDLSIADLSTQPDQSNAQCGPGSIAGWTPMWRPPVPAHQNVCSTIQIMTGVTALLGGSFAGFATNNPTCAACMRTDSQAAMLGALVEIKSLHITDGNRDGCVAILSGDASSNSCAASVQAQFDCGVISCGPTCPITNQTSLMAFNTCAVAAWDTSGPCHNYFVAGGCANFLSDDMGRSLDSCFLTTQGVKAWFTYLVTLFCGA